MNVEYAAADLTVRAATVADVTALSASLGARHGDYYRSQLPHQLRHKGVVLVAHRTSTPVGAAFVTWLPAREQEVRRELPNVPLVYRVQVMRGARRQGVGGHLLNAARTVVSDRGYRQMALGVDLHNIGAIRLYHRLGFRRWNHHPLGVGAGAYDMMVLHIEQSTRCAA